MAMAYIPVIASIDDVAEAAQAADSEDARWFVARKAAALRATDLLPDSYESIVAAFGGDWMRGPRKKAAAKGQALPDGSYPIRDTSDLRRAIQAYGRAKNKPRAKAHIIKRARALGATNMLPDSWRSGITASLERLRMEMDDLA